MGVDDKTNIEKDGSKQLGQLQETDKALINYEPDAYTPANSVKVIGKGQIQSWETTIRIDNDPIGHRRLSRDQTTACS